MKRCDIYNATDGLADCLISMPKTKQAATAEGLQHVYQQQTCMKIQTACGKRRMTEGKQTNKQQVTKEVGLKIVFTFITKEKTSHINRQTGSYVPTLTKVQSLRQILLRRKETFLLQLKKKESQLLIFFPHLHVLVYIQFFLLSTKVIKCNLTGKSFFLCNL